MNKYIQDSIRNNLRPIIGDLNLPQQKAISEVVRGLFTVGKPILSLLSQDSSKTAKKQSEKYSYHLGNVKLQDKINTFALRRAKAGMKKNTVIAYDLSDINKYSAKKMDNIASNVFDGSKRKITNGYTLHGVGINNVLVRLDIHNDKEYTKNQTRKSIVTEISQKLNKKGIWVFDRGNDDKQFFKYLRRNLKVQFIARLTNRRHVVLKKSGVKWKIDNLPDGKYEVYLMNKNNTKVDTRYAYTLVISNDDKFGQSMYLLSSIKIGKYSSEELISLYLERWGVENIFKRIKTKFNLESIRVLKFQRILNLVSLIQFAAIVITLIFSYIQKSTNGLVIRMMLLYKKFIRNKSLTFNIDSFITYAKSSLEPLIFRKKPPDQLSLLSRRTIRNLTIASI